MLFALASDLHSDRYADDQQIDWHRVKFWTKADILILAGDTADTLERTQAEVLKARQAFPCVIFVDGNHEHHGGVAVAEGMETMRRFAAGHAGIHYLDGGAGVVIGRTLVCGIAGWYDFRMLDGRYTPEQVREVWSHGRQDASRVTFGPAGSPEALADAQAAILAQRIRQAAADPEIGEIIVVTHTVPHRDGITLTGDDAWDITAATFGNSGLISIWTDCLDGGKLTVWCFGHTHFHHDFADSGVRFVCNPRGYPGEAGPAPYCVRLINSRTLVDYCDYC
jgi:predicted phosphodiesterase